MSKARDIAAGAAHVETYGVGNAVARRDSRNCARTACWTREECFARCDRGGLLQNSCAGEDVRARVRRAARCINHKRLHDRIDATVDNRGVGAREQSWMRGDARRGHAAHARRVDVRALVATIYSHRSNHIGDLAFAAIIDQGMRETHHDALASCVEKFARGTADFVITRAHERRAIGKRAFTNRTHRVRQRNPRHRHARKQVVARLIADLHHSLESLRHDDTHARAESLQQRVGRAGRGKPQFYRRQ